MNLSQADQLFRAACGVFREKKARPSAWRAARPICTRPWSTRATALARKLAVQRKELDATHNREQYKRMGDLITANLYQLEKGMRKATVVDYYDPDCPEVEITLDVRLTPQQNAQRYFQAVQQGQDRRGSADKADRAGKRGARLSGKACW